MNFILKIYTKIQFFFIQIHNFYRFLKFMYQIWKNKLFTYKKSEDILKVVLYVVRTEYKYYSNRDIMNRDSEKSKELLESLINKYLETHSEITLNQVLQVFKEEIIKRG